MTALGLHITIVGLSRYLLLRIGSISTISLLVAGKNMQSILGWFGDWITNYFPSKFFSMMSLHWVKSPKSISFVLLCKE